MGSNKIQFDEPQYIMSTRRIQLNLFVNFLIKIGLAKNERQAMYILFGVIGGCILITIFFLSYSKSELERPYDGGSNPEFKVNL